MNKIGIFCNILYFACKTNFNSQRSNVKKCIRKANRYIIYNLLRKILHMQFMSSAEHIVDIVESLKLHSNG